MAIRDLFPALAFLLLCPASGAAQTGVPQLKVPFVRVRWSGTTLHVTYQAQKIDHDFRDARPNQSKPEYEQFSPYQIESVKTQRLLEKDGTVYMLLDLRGPSRGPEAASSYCGAGTEKALVLLKMDFEGLLEEPQVVNYESCLMTIGTDAEEDDSQSLSPSSTQPIVKVVSFTRMGGPADPKDFATNRNLVTLEIRFDPARPEAGLATKEKVEDYKTATSKSQ